MQFGVILSKGPTSKKDMVCIITKTPHFYEERSYPFSGDTDNEQTAELHLNPKNHICHQKTKNSEFKPVKLRLKIDLVSHPARIEGLVYIYIYIYKFKEFHFFKGKNKVCLRYLLRTLEIFPFFSFVIKLIYKVFKCQGTKQIWTLNFKRNHLTTESSSMKQQKGFTFCFVDVEDST